MENKIKYVFNGIEKGDNCESCLNILTKDEVVKAKNFHSSFPQYKETPLAKLDNVAKSIGLGGIF
ncbi:MAG: diaminopropionate ammonia-lyase, partial [Cetobacterium sp.]